jgi:hypothetical protein
MRNTTFTINFTFLKYTIAKLCENNQVIFKVTIILFQHYKISLEIIYNGRNRRFTN